MSPLTFTPAREQDAALLVQLYNAAFRADYERYVECPAYGRTVEQMQGSIRRFPKLIIRRDGAPVGVLSAQQQDEGTYYIGCLCVIPQAQRQGIGSAALQWFCQQHPDWRVISLITPIDKAENLQFYQKNGFEFTGSQLDGSVRVATLEKRRAAMDEWILETPRLRLRRMTQADYPALCRMLQDPAVMYAYEGAFTDEEAQAWLDKQLRRYREETVGLWAVICKETGEMIGQCGLTWQDIPGDRVLEVGYLFEKAAWHHGYAAEAARTCRDYAFDTLGAQAVYSIIRDTSIATQHVAERNGMTRVLTFTKHYRSVDMAHYVYRVTRE